MAAGGGGFKAEYFSTLVQLEESNFWFRARNAIVGWALRKYFGEPRSLLEVGCGTGFVLSGIAKVCGSTQLTGSEIFIDGLSFAAERVQHARFVQMDARHMPYVEEFDVVASFDVLEHIEEDELVLRNCWQALKPGGGILLTVPQHQWLWSEADTYACHVRRYHADELHAKLERAGFDIVRSTSFTSLLLPAMMLSRRGKHRDKPFDPLSEFNIPPALNRTLEGILAVERQIMRMGIDFPAGGSRLVVARKRSY
ncbi:class I SAM-dependent methyltransferase [Cupriavidus sp. PET2-C1]